MVNKESLRQQLRSYKMANSELSVELGKVQKENTNLANQVSLLKKDIRMLKKKLLKRGDKNG